MSLGPFDLPGEPFLILYLALFAATIVAGAAIPWRLRPAGQPGRTPDEDQIAYLAGGPARFGDALVARLLATRALVMTGRDRFDVFAESAATTPAERAIVALPRPIRWPEIARSVKAYADPLADKMTRAGLLIDRETLGNIRFWAMLPYAMLFVFGATKWVIGDMREKPIGYLTALLMATVLIGALRWVSLDQRTQAGHDALAAAKEKSRRLRSAPTAAEIGLAVALFGTPVLVGSGWADFHKLRMASDGGSGSGGCSGGGGCGGGGCGGCGGG